MRKISFFSLVVLYILIALTSCTRGNADADVQAVVENIPVQYDAAPTAEISESNFAVEVAYLNGTWIPERVYKIMLDMIEEERRRLVYRREFTWGEGKSIVHTTFEIDIADERPFVVEPGLGRFPVTNITQTGINTIVVNVFRPMEDEPEIGFAIEFTFRFIDKDTVWIETRGVSGWDETGELLHRLSGPARDD